ncbi:MAG: 3-deoxy-D-manno-octulosonic acid transferase [Verrucomicrobia bacterium]|nr:MAG: 3-deoxy-D-manno-octulosonic acid transferase [Verrucomicrobiota bacterium]
MVVPTRWMVGRLVARAASRKASMRWFYNILFNIGFVLGAPFYLLKMVRRGNWEDGFGQRFGKYDHRLKQALTNRHVVWLHAVSVGEVNLCTQLIRALEPRIPHHKIVVSTTTSTGMAELEKHLPSHVSRIYYPIDRRKHVQRAMGTINPEAVVLVEAEIWPIFLWALQRRGIPHFLVNARLSERSYRGYRRFGFLFRPLFAGFDGVGAQNPSDAARLVELGCRPEAVRVVGSLKFDAARLDERKLVDIDALLAQLGVPADALVLVGGSTHAGEEAILADIASRLRARFPKLFLVLVPRHHERGREVGDMLASRGVRFAYRTEVTPRMQRRGDDLQCLLVNTTGELRFFYARADLVFVGKSLTAEGGQNPIEPAALGKPVVFGPNMQNFPQIVPQFVDRKGAVQVADAAELERTVERLLADPAERLALGQRGQAVVSANQGSLEKTVEMILERIAPGR